VSHLSIEQKISEIVNLVLSTEYYFEIEDCGGARERI